MFPGCLEPSLQSDLVLVSRDGVRSPCHAALLAVFSPLLANILGEVEDQEIILDWDSSLVTSLLQYLYTGEVRLDQEEHKEDLQEMMGHLGIVSHHSLPELKEEVEVEVEVKENLPSDLLELKRCRVSLENIKIQPENIEVDGEKMELMPTADRDSEYQVMQEQSFLLKPPNNSSKRSVKIQSDNVTSLNGDGTKRPQCLECGKSFSRPGRLSEHVKQAHSGPKNFHGSEGGESFRQTPRLIGHQKTEHGVSQQLPSEKGVCPICFKTLAIDPWNMALHMANIHQKRKILKCNICGFRAPEVPKTLMKTHLSQDHQIFTGPERKGSYTYELEDCEKKVRRNDLVICSICGLETNWKISVHMRFFHDDTPCGDCGMILKGVKEYKLHRKRVHTKEVILEEENAKKVNPEFICSTCGKGYSVKQSYLDHLVTHRPTPPYHKVCEHCGDQFDSRKEYAKHYNRKHAVPKRSEGKCEDCGKTFKNLKQHVKIAHLGLKKTRKPVPCPECNKIFSSNENLSYHMNVHTGAKPYQCFYCENAYQNKSNRNNHIKKSHPELYQKNGGRNENVVSEESQDQILMTFVQ